MNPNVYCGIDPGASGGIALIDEDDGELHAALKMPETEHDIADVFGPGCPKIKLAMIERVHAFPARFKDRDGNERSQGIASTAKFMTNYGFLRGLLTGKQIPFEDVPPVTWQRFLHCLTHGDKNRSKARAQQLYPTQKITHATADAILIARYCYLKEKGLLPPPIKVVRQLKPNPNQQLIAMPGMEGVDDFV